MKKILLTILFAPVVFESCNFVGNPQPEVNANLGDTASCLHQHFLLLLLTSKKY